MDHADTSVDGVPRRVHRERRAIDEHLARCRGVEPGEDVHEGRLACPILPEQCNGLTLGHSEIHIVIGEDTRKLFRDVAQFECDANLPVDRPDDTLHMSTRPCVSDARGAPE